jgi:hypothetical protein
MAVAERSITQSPLEDMDFNRMNAVMFSALSVIQLENPVVRLEKFRALRSFLEQFVDIDKLGSVEREIEYMEFVDNLVQQIEHLEIQTGERTLESIQRAGRRFAKKTQFPLGIILE